MDKRILLFTTIGKIEGETKKFITASFSSWQRQGVDVVVFGEKYHNDLCAEYGFTLDLDYKKDEFGLPIVRSLFQASQRYVGYDVYCYTNADIIFHSDLRASLNAIPFESYLAVGQRIDIHQLPVIDYRTQTHESISNMIAECRQELHNAGGIDYYAFTPQFWLLDNMPSFSIARGRFDHWLMGYALTKGVGPVVDITKTFTIYQPEPEERSCGTGDPAEAYNNDNPRLGYQLFRNILMYTYAGLHGQTDMAPYYLVFREESPIVIKRTEEEIPANEFNQKLIYSE